MKTARECFGEGWERKMHLGRGKEERSKRGAMVAEREKQVMIMSFFCCEPEITWLEVR